MPIRPENRARYPADWKAISLATKQRAGWRCEGSPDFPDCRVPHDVVGYRYNGEFVPMPRALAEAGHKAGDIVACSNGAQLKLIRVVLTVAHLDHTPENCAPENLRAWCQRCHLHYDRHHHATTRSVTRREGKALADLLDPAP